MGKVVARQRCECSDKRDKPAVVFEDGGIYCHRCGKNTPAGEAPIIKAPRPQPKASGRGAKPFRERRDKPVIAVYPYEDEHGAVLFEKVRFARHEKNGGRGGKYTWRHERDGRLYYGMGETDERPLYNQNAIAGADTVYICEGEKDAQRLIDAGLCAVTDHAGAWRAKQSPKWKAEQHNQRFAGKRVYVLPDNDEAGRVRGDYIGASLAGTAARVSIVKLPGLAEKGDVSDWLDAGHSIAELKIICETAAAIEPLPHAFFGKSNAASAGTRQWFDRVPKVTRPAPACECGKCRKCAVVTIWQDQTSITAMVSATRFECQTALHRYTVRAVNQISTEQKRRPGVYYAEMPHAEYKRWNQRNRKRGILKADYKPFHRADDTTLLVTDDDEDGHITWCAMPAAPDEVYDLLLPAIANGHRTRRNRGSAGWGGSYQGTKGDGRRQAAAVAAQDESAGECAQYVVKNGTIDAVCAALGATKPEDNTAARVQMYCLEAYQRLTRAGFELELRAGFSDIVTLATGAGWQDSRITDKDTQDQIALSVIRETDLADTLFQAQMVPREPAEIHL